MLTVGSGNRLGPRQEGLIFDGITTLHLDETLLEWDEVCCTKLLLGYQ